MIHASILADSIHTHGRITTFKFTFPRSILVDVNTHLLASKNTASSRAIPVKRRLEAIRNHPAVPPFWGVNQAGMTTGALSPAAAEAELIWLETMNYVLEASERMDKLGVHKQFVNRMAEPWAHVTQAFTITDVGNLFSLRCSEHTDPIFDVLMGKALRAYLESEPQRLYPGEWHIPFDIGAHRASDALKDEEVYLKVCRFAKEYLIHSGFEAWGGPGPYYGIRTLRLPGTDPTDPLSEHGHAALLNILVRLLISVSLCARISYETHDRDYTVIESVDHVINKVLQPGHPSPAQHQGQIVCPNQMANTYALHENINPSWSSDKERVHYDISTGYYWWGNFEGVRQFRKLLKGEWRMPSPADLVDILLQFDKRAKERGYNLE